MVHGIYFLNPSNDTYNNKTGFDFIEQEFNTINHTCVPLSNQNFQRKRKSIHSFKSKWKGDFINSLCAQLYFIYVIYFPN